MKNYISSRPFGDMKDTSNKELNSLLSTMVQLFDEDWIEQNKGHFIQKLWQRKDFLATNELLSLAYSIYKISNINLKWLQDQIKKVKSHDINNAKGALFEIIGFGHLVHDSYKIDFSAESNPGIDGTIIFNGNAKINLSMKSFGISEAEKNFNKNMEEIKKYFVTLITNSKLLTLQCVINFKKYPNDNDFNIIKKNIKIGVGSVYKIFTKGVFNIFNDIADITFAFLGNYRFASATTSYNIIALSPLYKNEFKNLVDKLEEACYNIIKQKKVESDDEINGIFVHLHENAKLTVCQEQMIQYFIDNPDKPISFIYLYSPRVTREPKTNSSQITHTILNAFNPIKYEKWQKQNGINIPTLNFFIGVCSLQEPPLMMVMENFKKINIENKYVYQYGEIYEDARILPDGTIEGDITNVASGIVVHSVINLNGKRMICKGKAFPEYDHLEIL